MKKKLSCFGVLLIFSFLIGFVIPDATIAAKVRKNIHKSFSLESGGKVAVKNTNGDIEIVSWDEERIDIQAEIIVQHSSRRRAEESMELVDILFDHEEDYMDIEVDQPNPNSGGVLSWLFGSGKPNVSVEFKIKVPEKAALKINTVNGAIEIDHVAGELNTRTTNGDIKLTNIVGKVSCKTVNGGISVELNRVDKFDDMSFSTVNGAIRISIPATIEATIDASTVNGGVDTELPLEVSGKLNRKSIRGTLNGGGGYITLKTVNGGITIRKSD